MTTWRHLTTLDLPDCKTVAAPSGSSTPTRTRTRTSSFTEQLDEGTPNRENASAYARSSSDSVNGSEPTIHQSGDTQSFAQKLQLRVPSMESLFRSPIKESLFRSSSKESLVRTSSRESLNRLELDSSPAAFDPPSDMESEAEDALGGSDSLNKEQLIQRLRRMERSLSSYRGKYSEVRAEPSVPSRQSAEHIRVGCHSSKAFAPVLFSPSCDITAFSRVLIQLNWTAQVLCSVGTGR